MPCRDKGERSLGGRERGELDPTSALSSLVEHDAGCICLIKHHRYTYCGRWCSLMYEARG